MGRKKGSGCHPLPCTLDFDHLFLDRQTGKRIEDRMERCGAVAHRDEISLPHLGKSVVQAPEVAVGKIVVVRLVPLPDHVGNHRLADCASVKAADHKIMSITRVDGHGLVTRDAVLMSNPKVAKLADGTADDRGKVAHNVRCVLPTKRYLVAETKIIANERGIASADTRDKRLVVRVAQTNDRAARRIRLRHVDLEKTEVALTVAGERVIFADDIQLRFGKLTLQILDKRSVRDREMAVSRLGSLDKSEISDADLGVFASANAEINGVFHTVACWDVIGF